MSGVLIIGGSGFIGENLIESLLKRNVKICVLDKNKPKNIDEKLIKFYSGLLSDTELLKKIFKEEKIEVVVHLVTTILPNSTYKEFEREMKNVVLPTYELLEIMQLNNVEKILFFSSGGTVYGNEEVKTENTKLAPISYYGYSKQIMEEYIEKQSYNGLKYIILRPSNPFGKFQDISKAQGLIGIFLKKILLNEEILIYGDGEITRDYIDVIDLAEITSILLNRNEWNEIYNIGTGKGLSINQILDRIHRLTRKTNNVKYVEGRKNDVKNAVFNIEKINLKLDNYKFRDFDTSLKNFYYDIKTGERK